MLFENWKTIALETFFYYFKYITEEVIWFIYQNKPSTLKTIIYSIISKWQKLFQYLLVLVLSQFKTM